MGLPWHHAPYNIDASLQGMLGCMHERVNRALYVGMPCVMVLDAGSLLIIIFSTPIPLPLFFFLLYYSLSLSLSLSRSPSPSLTLSLSLSLSLSFVLAHTLHVKLWICICKSALFYLPHVSQIVVCISLLCYS